MTSPTMALTSVHTRRPALPDDRTCARIASVAGSEFTPDLLARTMKRLSAYLLFALFALLGLAGCSIEEAVVPTSTEHVLVVYLGGDNNLNGEAAAKLSAIARGWSGRPCEKVVVYKDIAGSSPELVEIVAGNGGSHTTRTIQTYGAENSADAEVFGRVIREVLAAYPARSYGLVVFSHASGWLPEGRLAAPVQAGDGAAGHTEILSANPSYFTSAGTSTRSIIVDGKSEMELADFAAAIPDHAFSYIVFEACFMAGIEVAYELRAKADYILASAAEIVAPGFTTHYQTSLGNLFSNDPGAFGRAAFAGVQTYAPSDYRRSATFSLVRTAGLQPLADFIAMNCDWSRAVEVADVQSFDRLYTGFSGERLFFDFGDYHARLLQTAPQRAELTRLIDACVSWEASTETFMPTYGGFTIEKYSGLTAYIPQAGMQYLNAAYTSLAWAKAIRR